jgi:pseudaminic acid synthase
VDLPLIRQMAKTGLPLIMSTGMATLEEINEAVEAAVGAGCRELALLKCTSAYPAPLDEMNLRAIATLVEEFKVPVGLSDHSLELVGPIAAVALGASIIEKHLTITRDHPGPDSVFSLEPDEFSEMVRSIRATEKVLGSRSLGIAGESEKTMVQFRRSLFTVADIAAGERFTERNVRSIRPGTGLSPKHLEVVLNAVATAPIPRGTPLRWDHVGRIAK